LLKAQVLVRMSDKAQAITTLDQLTSSNLDESQRYQVTLLQKLIQVIK
jgi:outer membrane PBP1 activator LpoA protein